MNHAVKILSFCLLLTSASEGHAEPYAPQARGQHPNFTLPGITDGKPVSLSDFRGKKVLLVQFASW